MEELIGALQILLEYGNPAYPTHCEHNVLHICGIDPADVSNKDKRRLDAIGFFVSDCDGDDHFMSYRFGSA